MLDSLPQQSISAPGVNSYETETVISGNALLLAMLYYVYMCECVLDGVSAFVNGNCEVS